MSENAPTSVAELRARRQSLQNEEDAISYVRRLAQGRLDLVRDEQRRRATGSEMPQTSLEERLAEVFGQQHGGGSARPPRETNVASDHHLVKELDDVCAHYSFELLDTLDDSDLEELMGALEMFEKTCSQMRHNLFEQIDSLTAELVKKVRESGASSVVKDA